MATMAKAGDNEESVATKPSEMKRESRNTCAHFTYVLTIYRHVLLCLLFGSMSVLIGLSLLTVSLIIRAKTTSVHLIESVPLYMPGLIVSEARNFFPP